MAISMTPPHHVNQASLLAAECAKLSVLRELDETLLVHYMLHVQLWHCKRNDYVSHLIMISWQDRNIKTNKPLCECIY